jgi:signal transduction histidine kinase
VLLASDAGPVVDDLRRLGAVLAALWLLTTAMGVAVAVWLQRAVLRPVAGISQAIAGIDPANLQARVTMDVVPVEMRVVIERLNALLARLEAAFTRERTTIANIAHELRTPVAGLLLTLELAARQGGPGAATEPVRKSLRIAASMQAMITNLLMLSRLEAGQARSAPQAIDLDTALRGGWDLLEARADERRLEVEWETSPGLAAHADPEQLRMVVANILDNAISYAPEGSVIRITASAIAAPDPLAGGARLRVTNAIAGTPPDCGQIFQAFWRGDGARATGLHCGLGLALVQRLAGALGGSVKAEIDVEGRFCISLDLPGPPLAVVGDTAKRDE